MLYQKIKVACKDCPKRFYRVMYVREDLNLAQLGYVILHSLNAAFEHSYLFHGKGCDYLPVTWLEDCYDNEKDMAECRISDVQLYANNKFILEYDTGECWEFEITVYDEKKEINDAFFGTNVEAKGAGIWEDAHVDFVAFINGEEFECPWNMPEDSEPEDFDNEIDLEELNAETEVYEESFDDYYEDSIQE